MMAVGSNLGLQFPPDWHREYKRPRTNLIPNRQVAKTKQRIEEEKMQVLVVERTQQIMLQEQEITRREKELEAKVKKPAEAERYRLEKLAEAERCVTLTGFIIVQIC